MISAIIGDYVGSHYEHLEEKGYNLPIFNDDCCITDDTILMVATAESLLNKTSFEDSFRKWAKKYPNAGYGPGFTSWLNNEKHSSAGFSWGNGASTRGIPIGFLSKNEDEILSIAKKAAKPSHAHPEGIKGAQAVALTIHLLRKKTSHEKIIEELHKRFDYLLFFDIDELHKNYSFDSSAENSVPQAIFIGLKSKNHEDCLRKCLYIGGDTDTIMSIASAVYHSKSNSDLDDKITSICKAYLKNNHPEINKVISDFERKLIKK